MSFADPQIPPSRFAPTPADLGIKPLPRTQMPFTPGGTFTAFPAGGGKVGQGTSPNRLTPAPTPAPAPPPGVPAPAPPTPPMRPPPAAPLRLPPGVPAAVLPALLLELPQELPKLQELFKDPVEYFHNLPPAVPALAPPPVQPGFNRIPGSVAPTQPTPPPRPPGVPGGNQSGISYRVVIRQNTNGSIYDAAGIYSGPIWGIRVTKRNLTGTGESQATHALIFGNPQEESVIGAAPESVDYQTSIVSIERLDPAPEPPVRPQYPQPRRNFPPAPPTAPEQRQPQPPGQPPGMRPNQPPGTPAKPTPPGGGTDPRQPADPMAPAFPGTPPAQPTIPGLPGMPSPPLPLAMPVGAPGSRGAGGAGTAGGGAAGGSNPNQPLPSPDQKPATPPESPPATPTTPTDFCRFQYDQLVRNGVGQANTGISAANAKLTAVEAAQIALDAYIAKETATINSKLGDQLPNGGIGGKLGRMGKMIAKLYNDLGIDRVLNMLTWIGVLHNAYMLSSALGQTLFQAISSVLDFAGIQKIDEDGNEEPYDVAAIVGKFGDDAMKKVFGVETWNGIKADWKRLNRIYQAATNLLNAVQSMMYTMLDGLQTIGEYVSSIGNAAKTFGTFAENCYGWMNPKFNFMNSRFFRFMNQAQEITSNIAEIADSGVELQQQGAELYNQKSELEKAIKEGAEAKQKEEERKKTESRGAAVTTEAEQKPEAN